MNLDLGACNLLGVTYNSYSLPCKVKFNFRVIYIAIIIITVEPFHSIMDTLVLEVDKYVFKGVNGNVSVNFSGDNQN